MTKIGTGCIVWVILAAAVAAGAYAYGLRQGREEQLHAGTIFTTVESK